MSEWEVAKQTRRGKPPLKKFWMWFCDEVLGVTRRVDVPQNLQCARLLRDGNNKIIGICGHKWQKTMPVYINNDTSTNYSMIFFERGRCPECDSEFVGWNVRLK